MHAEFLIRLALRLALLNTIAYVGGSTRKHSDAPSSEFEYGNAPVQFLSSASDFLILYPTFSITLFSSGYACSNLPTLPTM